MHDQNRSNSSFNKKKGEKGCIGFSCYLEPCPCAKDPQFYMASSALEFAHPSLQQHFSELGHPGLERHYSSFSGCSELCLHRCFLFSVWLLHVLLPVRVKHQRSDEAGRIVTDERGKTRKGCRETEGLKPYSSAALSKEGHTRLTSAFSLWLALHPDSLQ